MASVDVVLKPASKAQQRAADTHTYASWGAPQLTLEQYLERERRLRDTAFAHECLMRYVLVPAADPETTDILSFVEVYCRPTVVFPASHAVDDDRLFLDGFSVGSVFTPPAHRKQGHAATLLARALAKMEAHLSRGAPYLVCNLYSDIGPDYYAAKGWRVHPSAEAAIPVAALSPPPVAATVLYAIDSPAALALVAAASQRAMTASLRPGQCAFLVTASVVDWFAARSRFYGETVAGLQSFPTSHGVYKVSSDGRVSDHVVWTHNFRDRKLVVLHWRVAAESAEAFLAAAAKEASAWGLTDVVLWNVDVPEPYKQFVTVREDALASLMVRRVADGGDEADIEWVGNEKYAWV